MTTLSVDRLRTAADAYLDREPFAQVERDRLETLPEAFTEGSYLWKDVQWVIRWYSRRPLTGQDAEREATFRNNGMDEIEGAIEAAQTATDVNDAVNALLAMEGVDVPMASALLYFMAPGRYVPITEPTWTVLAEAGRLDEPWPDACTPSDYERFLEACRSLADDADLPLRDVERALWQLSGARE